MTTSTNKTAPKNMTAKDTGGAIADALTLLRILLTPVVMGIIYLAWSRTEDGLLYIDVKLTAFASFLFVVAAISDIFDDYFGGTAKSVHRKLGYLDDIADTVLVVGVLAMLLYAVKKAGLLAWPLAIPAGIIILREIVVGLFKGFELSRYDVPDTWLSNLKTAAIMLGTCLLLASPWLTQWIDVYRANDANVMNVFDQASPLVWIAGQSVLWIGAVLSILSAVQLFRTDFTLFLDED